MTSFHKFSFMFHENRSVLLNLYPFLPHYNTSKFLNAPLILNIPYVQKYRKKGGFFVITTQNRFLEITIKNLFLDHNSFYIKGQFFCAQYKKIVFGYNSLNINISTKWTIAFAHISENFNISSK